MADLLIKALADRLHVLIAVQLLIIVAVLITGIVILESQDNATTVFSITTIEFNDTTITSTIDTNTSTLSSKPAIVSPASSTASVTSSAIDNTTTTTTCTTTLSSNSMTDCYDWLHINNATSNGIYRIDLGCGLGSFDVYCDMITDGGGWTVIQRRVDDSLEFYNNTWQQYKVGFNDGITRNLWLGNGRINVMSSRWNVILRVEIYGNRDSDNTNPNIYVYGTYNFSISDEKHNYTLYISLPIEGNASDAVPNSGFMRNNGMPFSTVDKSSNQVGSHCANDPYQLGGWWFNDGCGFVALNGKYNPTGTNFGFQWYNDNTTNILPNRSEMKIRRI